MTQNEERWFSLERPEPERAGPVFVEVPHAGLAIPDRAVDVVRPSADAIGRDADIYVDRLWAFAPDEGATLLSAKVSRFVVDLNRDENDIDGRVVEGAPKRNTPARGVIWRTATDGSVLLKRPLHHDAYEERMREFYRPYHDALRMQLAEHQLRYGVVYCYAAHSMPSHGRSRLSRKRVRRADIVPGSLGRSSACPEMIELADAHFRSYGLSVKHDEPYRGGFTTQNYGRPEEHTHVLQIEINRALYVDELTLEPKPRAFAQLQEILRELVQKSIAYLPRRT